MRGRILAYFLLFTALLLALLWLFQIVLLDDFYRYQKTEALKTSAEGIARNIDNEGLQTLVDRIGEQGSVSVLVLDGDMNTLATSENSPGSVIHSMSRHALRRYLERLDNEGDEQMVYEVFPMVGFRNVEYDARRFSGRVPPADDGSAKSMLALRRATAADGSYRYILLNTIITPVTSTVQTLRAQFGFISALLVLMSLLISLVLSRRVTRPIEETTLAARALSQASYTPVRGRILYREVAELNRTLQQAAVDLGKVEAMQRELIANISHDLRTPLTLIEGYAEAMRDIPGESSPENMQVIIDEAKRLTTLVNAILDYSAGHNGDAPIEPAPYDLTRSIRDILTRYQKLTEQDGYTVRFAPEQSVIVNADELKIGQVVYNLVNNALTYTGEDGVVTVEQKPVPGGVRVTVRDTGEGIAPEELPYIWSRYYRGQKPHKRAAIGTGLGLSIVQSILDSHGVAYGVESEPGHGSGFWFELPTVSQPESPTATDVSRCAHPIP